MKENGVASDKPLDSAIATRIKKFANLNRLKKEALKVTLASICLHPAVRTAARWMPLRLLP